MPSACVVAPMSGLPTTIATSLIATQMLERLDERLGFDDAGVGRPERGDRADVWLLGLDEIGVDELDR